MTGRILVTGGAGVIGSHLVEQLVQDGSAEVVVLDNLSRGRVENLGVAMGTGRATLVEGDIRDRALLARLFDGVDVLFHLAAIRLTHCATDPRLAMAVMVDGTYDVMEAAVAAKIPRVVAASSASVYGMAEHFPTAESVAPWGNRTLYGAAKLFNEGLLRSFHAMYGLNYVALRPFNVYGPRMDRHGAYTEVLIRWMDRIARGNSPVIFGDGSQSMDFVYVEDVARAFLLAARSPAVDEVFNVASGVETSLNELAAALLRVMGSTAAVEYAPGRGATDVRRRLADTRLARERLGFSAEVGLDDGLARLVAWWRAAP
jgi:UDP-glucose 4-epimerase